MIFIFGSRLFGKVDAVPGLFHVATRFGHIDYVPLIPMQSWLVFEQSGDTWRGVPIPFSFKSLVTAWGRAISIAASVAMLVITLVSLNDRSMDPVMSGLATALAVGLLVFLYRYQGITHASYERACELAQIAGFSEEGMAHLRQIFGRSRDHASSRYPSARSTPPPLSTAREQANAAEQADFVDEPDAQIESQATAVATAPQRSVFFVTGRDRHNGQEVCITVHAENAEEASQFAAARNVQVSKVELSNQLA